MARHTARLAGFSVLAIITLLLFALGFKETIDHQAWLSIFPGLILVGLICGIVVEWQTAMATDDYLTGYVLADVVNILAVLGGTLATYFFSVNLGLGSVVASATTGLFGALALKRHAVPIFCGSFVGMACPTVFMSYPCVILAGTCSGLLYILAKGLFDGCGGKLGTIAFAGSLAASMIRGMTLQTPAIPSWDISGLIIGYSVAGVLATYLINVRLGHGPVLASAFVGLFAGLILPGLHGQDPGRLLALMVFCASFAGMSGQKRLANELQVILAGLFCGIMFVFTSPWLGGAGGKLGTIAFGSVIAVSGLASLKLRVSSMLLSKY